MLHGTRDGKKVAGAMGTVQAIQAIQELKSHGGVNWREISDNWAS